MEDMHPEDIKAALHKKNITLTSLAVKYGLTSPSTLSAALTRSLPLSEKRIADALEMHPMQIWPSRYTEVGNNKKRGIRK